MSNNFNKSLYETIYEHLDIHPNVKNLIIEIGESKRGDKYKKFKLKNNRANNFDITLNIWENAFKNCGIVQVYVVSNGNSFQIFYEITMNDGNPEYRLVDFARMKKCEYIFAQQHKVPNQTPENLEERKQIYAKTKKMIDEFNVLLETIF
jgi:hypothetical protein